MPTTVHTLRNLKQATDTLAATSTNLLRGNAAAITAGQVIAHRLSLGAAALFNPWATDHAEFSRLVPEKAIASFMAGNILLLQSGQIAQKILDYTAKEMMVVGTAMTRMPTYRTAASMLAANMGFAMGWYGRALSQSLALGLLAARAQGAATAPGYRMAHANARRLLRRQG